MFQMYVQLTRLKIQTSKPKSSTTVQMFERSVQNNRFCFVEQAYRHGYLHKADYGILDEWYRFIRSHMDITLDLIGNLLFLIFNDVVTLNLQYIYEAVQKLFIKGQWRVEGLRKLVSHLNIWSNYMKVMNSG